MIATHPEKIAFPMSKIGARIKWLRKEAKLTQKQLATRAGIKQPSLSEIETGETKEVVAETLLRLAAALEVNPFYLFSGRGTKVIGQLLSEQQYEWLALFEQLDASNQQTIVTVARAMLDAQNPPLNGDSERPALRHIEQ